MKLTNDDREPVVFLNYRRMANPNPKNWVGPTMNGERLWPVTVEARENGGSRVGYSYLPPS